MSASAALALSADTLIRFLPVRNFYGDPPPLLVYGIDNSYTGGFTGVLQTVIDATSGGGDSPISATPVALTTSVDANVWVHTADGDPSGGDWGTGGNWTNGVPGEPEVVIIDLPSGQKVVFDGDGSTTTATIGKLVNTGGGTLEVIDAAVLKVRGPTTNTGEIKAGRDGEVSFKLSQVDNQECAAIEAKGCGSLVDFSWSFVRNAGLIAAFSQGLVTFDHVILNNTFDGAIKADGCGSEIDFNNTLITSAGLIEAKQDGFITFDRVVLHNGADGTIETEGRGSKIDFSHSYVANGGLVEAKWGGVVSFHGGTVDNTHHGANDGAIEAIGRDSVVKLYDTHVVGGMLQTSHGGVIEVESGSASGGTVFDGSQTDGNGCTLAVTIDGHVLIEEKSDLTLLGTIHNHGTIEVDAVTSLASHLVIDGSVTLDGCGYVKLDGSNDSIVGSSDYGNVLHNVDNTIYGAGSIGHGGGLKLVNESDGTVDANVRSGTLTIDTGWHHVVNAGLLEATHGGSLVIDSDVSNDCGLVEAGGASHVTLAGDIFGGHALINGGTLEYDGASNVSTEFACNTAGTLVLGAGSDFCGQVSGFGAGDILDFKGIGFSNCTDLIYCAGDGTLTVSDGGHSSTVHLTGSYDPSDFAVFNDGTGHAAVAEPPQANDDIVIASESALDNYHHLTIRSDALLANDANPIPGDKISLESVSGGHACLDVGGNVTDRPYGSADSFSYTLDDDHGLQSTAQVQVSVQCGSLTGTCANEIILPGSESACLTGGGGNDTFLFQNNVSTGQYDITDFTTHSHGGGADTITLDDFACIKDFCDVLDHAQNCGGNTVIDLGLGNMITIRGVNVGDLTAADFSIHHASTGGGGGGGVL